jgi:hypothetical protein
MKYPARWMAISSVVVVLAKTLLAGTVIGSVTIGGIDPSLVGALLTPTLALYASSLHRAMDDEEKEPKP